MLVISSVLLLGLTTGCNTLSTKGKLYATLESTQIAVHNAMNEYGRLVRAGKVNDSKKQEVRTAYLQYQSAYDAAVVAASFDYKSATPENVRNLRDIILNIVLSLTTPAKITN